MLPREFIDSIAKYKTNDTISTHWIAENKFKYNIPSSDLSKVYTDYLTCDPRPCLVEKIIKAKFPLFFDFDYKVDEFVTMGPFGENAAVKFDFGPEGPRAWFNNQRKVAIDSLTKVIEQITDQPFSLDMSLRTCYKYHVFVTNLVVDEATANHIRTELIKEWIQHPDYRECDQPIDDIIDKKVYTTGLRMLGGEKTGLDDQPKLSKGKVIGASKSVIEKKAHETIFGDMEDYQTAYPTVVGFDLNLTLLKKYSMLIDQDLSINVKLPNSWSERGPHKNYENTQEGPARKKQKNKNGHTIVQNNAPDINPTATSQNLEMDQVIDDEMLMNAASPFISIPEIKLRRTLNEKTGTECIVLVEQPCHFKGSCHSRTYRNQDTMWILKTQRRAELRCYACKSKCQVLCEYNPPSARMLRSIVLPCHATVANVVISFVQEYMAAATSVTSSGKVGSGVIFYIYDYNSNVWREDQFYLFELISNTEGELWRAYENLRLDSDDLRAARDKLLMKLGTAQFRNCVMDMVGRKLIQKWHLDLGDIYFSAKLNQNRNLFICENGTWDFSKKIFRPGLPSDCSTLSCEREYIPFKDYSLEIREKLITFVARIFPEEDEKDYMMEQFANALDPSQKRELVFILYGDGGNGKTAICNLNVKATGGYAGTASQSLLTQQPPDSQKPREDIMGIRNSRNLTVSELTSALVLSTMKVMSSHDRWSARSNNSATETFYMHFIIFILTNEIPKIAAGAADNGTWRRLIFVPFRSKFVGCAAEITNPKYHFLGSQYSLFDATLEELAAPYLSYLIDYKMSGITYPMPKAYLEEQERQKSKNSIYSRFVKDVLVFPTLDKTTNTYIPDESMESSMMLMFVNFTNWLRMRRTVNQIDFDKFNEQMSDVFKHMKPPIYARMNEDNNLIYPVGVKALVAGNPHHNQNHQNNQQNNQQQSWSNQNNMNSMNIGRYNPNTRC